MYLAGGGLQTPGIMHPPGATGEPTGDGSSALEQEAMISPNRQGKAYCIVESQGRRSPPSKKGFGRSKELMPDAHHDPSETFFFSEEFFFSSAVLASSVWPCSAVDLRHRWCGRDGRRGTQRRCCRASGMRQLRLDDERGCARRRAAAHCRGALAQMVPA